MVTLSTNGTKRTETRVKLCSIPLSILTALLTLDGESTYKFEGYPKDAKVIGARIEDSPARVTLVLYHPEFPICLGQPEQIKITAKHIK